MSLLSPHSRLHPAGLGTESPLGIITAASVQLVVDSPGLARAVSFELLCYFKRALSSMQEYPDNSETGASSIGKVVVLLILYRAAPPWPRSAIRNAPS